MGKLAGVSGQGPINEYSPLVDRSSPQRGELQGTDRHARSLAGSQELPVPAGRLDRLKAFILSPIRALMAWVNRLLNRTESSGESLITRAAVDPEQHLPFLSKGSAINIDNYGVQIVEGGELNRRHKELESLQSIGFAPFSGQAGELLGYEITEGSPALDFVSGSELARKCIATSGHHARVYIAEKLNSWNHSALELRNAAYAEIKQTSDARVFENGSELASLYERGLHAFLAGTADTRAVFYELINRKFEDISIGEWARRVQSATDWLENAKEDKQCFVAWQLGNWAKDASKHLANAEVRASGSDERSA